MNHDPQQHDSLSRPSRRLSTKRARRWRWLAIVLAVVMVGTMRLALLQGLVRPLRVVGGSMADRLRGEHYLVNCADCRLPFCCDAQQIPHSETVVCPNCGYSRNELQAAQRRPGDRVLIDRFPFLLRQPNRWEMVAFKTPNNQAMLGVKRLVGLPGERLSIGQGDLYIDDLIVRKTFPQQRSMALLVHDNDYQPQKSRSLPARWQSDQSNTLWKATGGSFVYDQGHAALQQKEPAREDHSVQPDWLMYRHFPCLPLPIARDKEMPVLDLYGTNQDLSRQLNEVSDLMLSCRLKMIGLGSVWLLVHDGRELFQIELDCRAGKARLLRNSELVAAVDIAWPREDREVELELAVCDAQILLAIEKKTVLRYPYAKSKLPFQPTSRPLGIGAAEVAVRVSQLRVFRDIYWLHPADIQGSGRAWTLGRPLEDDEYLVLGDNVPISEDSRNWTQGISRKSLLGKVLRLHPRVAP